MERGRLERAYRAFVRCHEVVAGTSDEARLLHDLCEAAVSELGFRLAWVGLVVPGEARLHAAAGAGYEAGYLTKVEVTWTDDAHGQGPTGRAVRERRTCVSQDIATDPRFAPWREDALARGYASSAAIPLVYEATCLGALSLYAAEPRAFDDDELALLEEMALDLTLGLVCLRNERRVRNMSAVVERAARAEVASLMAATVAHDVNNLLQVAHSFVDLAHARGAASVDTDLTQAARALDDVAALMRRLLPVSRRSLETLTYADPDQVLRSLQPLLARLAPHLRLALELAAPGALARVAPLDLERVVINLVVNAAQATPDGGTLAIATRLHPAATGLPVASGLLPPGDYVEVRVSDTGRGIASDLLPRVFEPHFTTKGGEGSGLGLASVQATARTAGGGAAIQSRVGEGTRVSVFFPLAAPG